MPKHQDKKVKKCKCSPSPAPKCKCEPVPPWSETNWEPDTQWCPMIPIRKPLKVVQTPFYTSSEDPAPEWAPNIIIRPPVCVYPVKLDKHHKHHDKKRSYNPYGGCEFLRSHWRDDVPMYVYGRNPFSDTVNSGGSHFQ